MELLKVVKRVGVVKELLKWKRRVLRQWPRREAVEFCCGSAETKWRSCRILSLEKLLESIVRVKWIRRNYQDSP